ncbi:PAS domain-containing sensor histidine kinase [Limnohabitans sp. Rim8]|uniref:histidine kinase n=1 Tax=Limnohabitans curvus TaxID=323423 RepID=A0A315EPQ6_9BURK|nr:MULTISPECIES: ATP-binding protein [Limnohabitans]PUE59201.1 PAS domain-containing sensor histidine kinase [Limnohabitans curvus]PUE62362.1 PAS domain-containing sensor histidine kinase [Limnohabitans sp. Rim8]
MIELAEKRVRLSRFQLRWLLVISATVVLGLGLVLLFLLTQATDNRELYERNYRQLFGLNVVVATLLMGVIAWLSIRLLLRLRQGKFGSRLLLKIAATFALVGFVPGLLIYSVSYQFVSRSIESWFDVKVEGALDAGLSLGRTTLDTLANDLGQKTRSASVQINDLPDASVGVALDRMKDQLGADDVILWNTSGQALASAGDSRYKINPERPSPAQLRLVKTQSVVTAVDGLDEADSLGTAKARIRALVLVAPSGLGLLIEPRVLQVTKALPPTLVSNALAVEVAYREYQERALGREGLRSMYIGTLTLSLFLAVFGAVLLAVLLGNQLARPLLMLAEGVRDVAAGDLSPKPALQGRDELGGLTRSFAQMTQQLADARSAVDRSMLQVHTSRANLQTILDNLTAGVIVMTDKGLIKSSNPGATRILRVPLAAWEGRSLSDIEGLAEFAQHVQSEFDGFLGERSQHGLDHWQQSFELHATAISPAVQLTDDMHQHITLLARGAVLPNNGRLLVFDDISEIVSAQRAQAWGEVARRLAHEIKNPLTPIQLSAERLEMKLTGKLQEPEQLILNKSVKTIVDQVDAMKRLVNEFRDYARLPVAELKPLDLNALVQDVMQLYGTENASVPVHAQLDPTCPIIQGDAQQLRQVVHNLLQNAQDATEGQTNPMVSIATQWVPSSGRVRLVVRDNGPGFPPKILNRAFEPYVTTKSRGTGLGLAVVKKIADEHSARIDLKNRGLQGRVIGAQVSLSFQVAESQQTQLI